MLAVPSEAELENVFSKLSRSTSLIFKIAWTIFGVDLEATCFSGIKGTVNCKP